MSEKRLNGRIINKHDTEANWLKATGFIPMLGEIIIYEPDANNDTPRFKVGDGKTVVSSLPFATSEIPDDVLRLDPDDVAEDGTVAMTNSELFAGMTYDQVKEDILADVPADAVTSVNGKVGAVTLTASDVGAASSIHTHALPDMTGTLTIAKGGTGATTVAAARNALGLGNTSGAVPIANGGTGATTAITAADSLSVITAANLTDSDHTIASGADLNTYTTPGAYKVANAATAASLINGPSYVSAGFRLIVSYTTHANGIIQLAIYNSTNTRIWKRLKVTADTWSSWTEILDTSKAVSVVQGGTGATTAADARTALGITPANIGAATSTHSHDYLPLTGGTVTGQLILSRTTDVGGTSSSDGALIIGNKDGAHIAFDGNEIMAKGSDTTTANLHLNTDGGGVYANSKLIWHKGNLTMTLSGTTLAITTE